MVLLLGPKQSTKTDVRDCLNGVHMEHVFSGHTGRSRRRESIIALTQAHRHWVLVRIKCRRVRTEHAGKRFDSHLRR